MNKEQLIYKVKQKVNQISYEIDSLDHEIGVCNKLNHNLESELIKSKINLLRDERDFLNDILNDLEDE